MSLACILRDAAAACHSISSSCVSIQGLPWDKNGNDVNGQWTWAGCHNDQPYYISSSLSNLYNLCYGPYDSQVGTLQGYVILNGECETDSSDVIAWNLDATTNVISSQNTWMVETVLATEGMKSTPITVPAKPIISECNNNGKFEMGETADGGSTSYSSTFAIAVLLAVMMLAGLVCVCWKWRSASTRSLKPQQIADHDEEQTTALEQIEDEPTDLEAEIEIEVELQRETCSRTDSATKAVYCG